MVLDDGAKSTGVGAGVMAFDEVQETVIGMGPAVVGHLELTLLGEE